jgi:hypothetical protein
MNVRSSRVAASTFILMSATVFGAPIPAGARQ